MIEEQIKNKIYIESVSVYSLKVGGHWLDFSSGNEQSRLS